MDARDFTQAFLSLVEDRNRPKVGLWPFPKVVPPPPPPTEERKQVGVLMSFSLPLHALDSAPLSAWRQKPVDQQFCMPFARNRGKVT